MYRSGVGLPDRDVPATFGKVWQDAEWRAALVDWAAQQPDWSGHLVATLIRVEAFRANAEPTAADAQRVLEHLLLACPPLDITLFRDARRLATSGRISAALFDRTYVTAYQVLTNNKHVLDAFRAAVAEFRASGPAQPGGGLAPVGPLGIWSKPPAAR
jgi:hypothetical protein